jgi:predicted TIM-barrel fold metal-dependent hydrolase
MQGKYPMYYHMGDDRPQYQFSTPAKLAHVKEMFPKLEVVAAHLGGYLSWDAAVEYLAGRDGVWFDTSSALWAMDSEQAFKLIRTYGSDRVMFGTDYPVMHAVDEIKRVEAIGLTDAELENIYYKSATNFLKL